MTDVRGNPQILQENPTCPHDGDVLRNYHRCKKFSEITPESRRCKFENFDPAYQPEAFKLCKEYVAAYKANKAIGAGLLMSGINQVGKTHLAYSIANEIMRRYSEFVVVVTADSLVRKVSENRYDTRIYRLCPLLIVDDLGRFQGNAEYHSGILFSVYDSRKKNCLPTITVTNFSEKGLTTIFGDPTIYCRASEKSKKIVFKKERRYRSAI